MFDWKKLSPHLPLDDSDAAYVERPVDGAARLATKIRAGLGPVVVTGPVGCGKSTELARASALLASDYTSILTRLDRIQNLRATGEKPDLVVNVIVEAVVRDFERRASLAKLQGSNQDRLLMGLRSLKSVRGGRDVVLLYDGLEKMRAEVASAVVREFLELRHEARLVLVVPPSLVIGPDTYALSSEDVRVFSIRVIPPGSGTGEGERFLKTVAMRRLGVSQLPPDLEKVFDAAVLASGGLPRTFLQFLQDAAGYASIEQRAYPSHEDLRNALQDHAESIQRLLREGDRDALRLANGTDGLEMQLERRLRLLSQGVLLEYATPSGRSMVMQHPLTNPNILKMLGLA